MHGSGKDGGWLLVVGAGAIANRLLPYVMQQAWTGVTVMDGDRVEQNNLERQPLFTGQDVGKPKCEVLAARLRKRSKASEIASVDAFMDGCNADGMLARHDVVADCTDDAHVKRLLDRTCADHGVALVSGSVHGKEAQVIALHAEGEGRGISRDDLFHGKPGMEQDGCDMRHVPMKTVEETAHRMAQLLHALLNQEPVANGRIDLFDGGRWTAIDPPNT